jgi:hypothetical protein
MWYFVLSVGSRIRRPYGFIHILISKLNWLNESRSSSTSFLKIQKQPKCKPSVIEHGNHVSDPTKISRGSVVHQCANNLHNGNKSYRQYIPVTCLPNDSSKGRSTIKSASRFLAFFSFAENLLQKDWIAWKGDWYCLVGHCYHLT